MSDTDPWLTTPEVAKRLRQSVHTLHDWAYKGIGPAFAKVGRRRLYRESAVVAYERQRESAATGG